MNDLMTREVQMTSLDLAELTGKRHDNVMRDIRNEIEALRDESTFGLANELIFELVEYTDSKGEKRPCYSFGKDGAMQLALKYDPLTRRKVIKKLDELEGRNKPLQINSQFLFQLATKLEEQEKTIAIMSPKAEMFDTFLSVDSNQTMNEAAKAIGIGRNKLFNFLRENHILMRSNLPYQEYIDRGYFTVREVTIRHSDWEDIKRQTLVTPKGVEYITKLLKKYNKIA